jgi:hypothetical protein
MERQWEELPRRWESHLGLSVFSQAFISDANYFPGNFEIHYAFLD